MEGALQLKSIRFKINSDKLYINRMITNVAWYLHNLHLHYCDIFITIIELVKLCNNDTLL